MSRAHRETPTRWNSRSRVHGGDKQSSADERGAKTLEMVARVIGEGNVCTMAYSR